MHIIRDNRVVEVTENAMNTMMQMPHDGIERIEKAVLEHYRVQDVSFLSQWQKKILFYMINVKYRYSSMRIAQRYYMSEQVVKEFIHGVNDAVNQVKPVGDVVMKIEKRIAG